MHVCAYVYITYTYNLPQKSAYQTVIIQQMIALIINILIHEDIVKESD